MQFQKFAAAERKGKFKKRNITVGLIMSTSCLMEKSSTPRGCGKVRGKRSNMAVIVEEAPQLNYTVC